jgi:hypothetical protein
VVAHIRQVDMESVFLSREPGEFSHDGGKGGVYLQEARILILVSTS